MTTSRGVMVSSSITSAILHSTDAILTVRIDLIEEAKRVPEETIGGWEARSTRVRRALETAAVGM